MIVPFSMQRVDSADQLGGEKPNFPVGQLHIEQVLKTDRLEITRKHLIGIG